MRVNINNVCNAYWQPSGGFNGFFQEGFSGSLHCYNTGEIAGVFMHEVGHGIDQNDAQGTGSQSGEAYADTTAMLQLHVSCMGESFWSQQCPGYGVPCSSCTGVRDQDYAKHLDGGNPVTIPFTPANYTLLHCGSGGGQCNGEVHCESYVPGGAIWDLAERKLNTQYDQSTSWYQVERDWVLGSSIFTNAFACSGGGASSNGCAATSWFEAMRATDDDNGNLTDGTPHAAFLFSAFNDHLIACGAAGDAANQNSAPTCPSLAAPTVSIDAGPAAATSSGTPADTIRLTWNAVANAGGYAILKNHGDCSLAYQQRANVGSGVLTYDDTDVVEYQDYGYRVVALKNGTTPGGNACYSDLSNCAKATVSHCPNATASAPGLTNPVDNQVDVTWDNSGSCASFNVYRRQGTCAAGGTFSQIANGQAGPTYQDHAVSGGLTYSYELAALDPTGTFETGRSPCAEITPTGVCNEAPSFLPMLSADNSQTVACGVDLNWNSGSTICPAQSVVYNLYRSTSSGFTPGNGNRIASGLAGTTYHDASVSNGVTYYYIVRAEALTGAGPGPNGGVEDLNTDEASAAPTYNVITFSDNLESGTGNWTVSTGSGASPWTLASSGSHSPTHAWFVPDTGSVNDQRLAITSPFVISSGAVLRFWNHYQTEFGGSPYDGGVLEYSTNGGSTWFDILAGDGGSVPANPARFVQGGYVAIISSCCSNPLAGRSAWVGDNMAFEQVIVDLADFVGQSVAFRWRFGSDSSIAVTGWWVDDVDVVKVNACSNAIFIDGFESGDTSAWSLTFPP